MPDASQVLASLQRIAVAGVPAALAWHVAVTLAAVAVLLGWRPSRRAAATLTALPLASVSAFAWAHGNPFNGVVFAVLTLTLVTLAVLYGDAEPASLGPGWARVAGGLLVAFGLVYPHFVPGARLAYLVVAPFGLLPCPTLAVVCGVTAIGGGLGLRGSTVVLGVASLAYAVIGSSWLGVELDLALSVGAAATLALALTRPMPTEIATAR